MLAVWEIGLAPNNERNTAMTTRSNQPAVNLHDALLVGIRQRIIDLCELYDLDAFVASTAEWHGKLKENCADYFKPMLNERPEVIERTIDATFDTAFAEAMAELRYAADEAQYLMNRNKEG